MRNHGIAWAHKHIHYGTSAPILLLQACFSTCESLSHFPVYKTKNHLHSRWSWTSL